jgi:hypothetical protein
VKFLTAAGVSAGASAAGAAGAAFFFENLWFNFLLLCELIFLFSCLNLFYTGFNLP